MIKIGLIGLGQRGTKTILRYFNLNHAKIVAIADIDKNKVLSAKKLFNAPILTFYGEQAWQDICQLKEVDLIYVCTHWTTHASIAIYAMKRNKDVVVEVPIATSIEDCWKLIDTAKETQKHCFMAENCCYDKFHLASMEMHRKGLLGKINHFEGAYIHNLLSPKAWTEEILTHNRKWMKNSILNHGGNPYPTHAIGPICQLLKLNNDGDRLDYLISLSSGNNKSNEPYINTTLIKTINNRTILLQFDVTTDRPYSRLQTICGTKGYMQKYPLPTVKLDNNIFLEGDKTWEYIDTYLTSDAAKRWKKGHKLNVENEMNYAMDSRLIHCLNNNIPLDIDIYDAVTWSSIAPLSKKSASEGGTIQKIPYFR